MATLEKAKLMNVDTSDSWDVLFNPKEYSVQKSVQWEPHKSPGLDTPEHEFTTGNPAILSVELFFDTYTNRGGSDVRKETKKISRLLEIDPTIHAPPPVKFVWGPLSFQAVIERLTQRFTMFREDGVPVRATLNVTFKEYKTIQEQLSPNPNQSTDWTKRRVVADGDSLSLIAAIEYGDPGVWRVIADENEIENPRVLQPGMELRLPPLR